MSEVITGVLKLAFGFISNKLRTYGAEKLQDGDLTYQKFRGWIVREMDEIKSKLDAISRKDLCASISFLQQGVQRLNLAFDESVEGGGPSSSELSSSGESSTSTKPAQPSVTIKDAVALASAVGKLKLDSNKLFMCANESFKEAGKQATLAFHNAALSTEDRILSSKVRIASSILEHLDHTEVAASDCLHYLQELHNMPAIQEIFLVHIQGGMKSLFKKTSRAEIVETVTMVNLILADFITKFTKRRMAVFDWPQMQCGKQSVHPIHYEAERERKMRKMEITPPWHIVECKADIGDYAMNSKGDIICVLRDGNIFKLDRPTRRWQPFSNDEGISQKSIAISDNDTLYIVSSNAQYLLSAGHPGILQIPQLSAYSSDGKVIYHRALDFIRKCPYDIGIAITNDNKIVIICSDDYRSVVVYYVCDIKGELIKRFDKRFENLGVVPKGPFVTSDNEIAVAINKAANDSLLPAIFFSPFIPRRVVDVYVCSLEGKWKSPFRLLQRPSPRPCSSMAFNHATKSYTVGRNFGDDLIFMDVSGTSEPVRYSIFLDQKKYKIFYDFSKLVSHRNGSMALVSPKGVLYLQSPSK